MLWCWLFVTPTLATPAAEEDEKGVEVSAPGTSAVEVALDFLRKVFEETTAVKEASGTSEPRPRDSARARARHTAR